tara:strand:- start:2307 stop:2516 length:210 start_codon:yes stop_codon:yes gene_type:complete
MIDWHEDESQYNIIEWSSQLQQKIDELERRVQELEMEKHDFINEIYRVENVLDARIDRMVNELQSEGKS